AAVWQTERTDLPRRRALRLAPGRLRRRAAAALALGAAASLAVPRVALAEDTGAAGDNPAATRLADSSATGDGAGAAPPPQPLRVLHPDVPPGPRRVGLQAGHWLAADAPDELRRLSVQTGTSWGAVAEWQLNLDVANRVA